MSSSSGVVLVAASWRRITSLFFLQSALKALIISFHIGNRDACQ
jgi:hypothetical protein